MATGRTDPDRRDRIIDAALDLIADEGVAGLSHRKVAARAGVPLGSTPPPPASSTRSSRACPSTVPWRPSHTAAL